MRDEIAARGCAHATVTGTSMLPTLRAGELVRLEAAGEVLPGHIVAFEYGGGLLVHRIVSVAPDHVVCRGDNRLMHDGLTPRAAIVGRAVEVFGPGRRGGVRLRDDATALRRADARLAVRRVIGRCRHVGAEALLLSRQVARRPVRPPAGGAEDAGELSSPFALSSRLAPDVRVALVRTWRERQPPDTTFTVRALALAPSCRLARAGAAMRRALARAGIAAGRPGDAVLPGAESAALQPVHLFSRDELVAELAAAGVRVVRLEPEVRRGAAVWRATVRVRAS